MAQDITFTGRQLFETAVKEQRAALLEAIAVQMGSNRDEVTSSRFQWS